MSKKAPRPKVKCKLCGKYIALKPNGRLNKHRTPAGAQCKGHR